MKKLNLRFLLFRLAIFWIFVDNGAKFSIDIRYITRADFFLFLKKTQSSFWRLLFQTKHYLDWQLKRHLANPLYLFLYPYINEGITHPKQFS